VLLADQLRFGAAMKLAVAAVLAYGTLNATLRDRAPRLVAVVLIAVTLAIFVVTVRIELADRMGIRAYLGMQCVLVTVSMVLGHGIVTLHYTPIIAQAALVCRRRVLVALCVALGAESFALGQYFQRDLTTSAIETVGFAALTGFVVAFVQAVAAERRARASVEQLATIQERNRLAREIHDTLAQGLTGVVVQLGAAQRALAAESDAADQHIELAQQMARESLAEARRSVWNLRAPALERGDLSDALRGLASRPIRPETSASFEQHGEPWPLPPGIESALLRVGQEALVNVAKHAGATHVRLMLEYTPDAVRLSISDDGVGFDELPADVAAPGPWGGFGLLGMRERLVALGGTLELTSDGGAQVVAVVPRESIQQPGVRSQKVHIHSES